MVGSWVGAQGLMDVRACECLGGGCLLVCVYVRVSAWVCSYVSGCVFLIQGIHCSRCGLSFPVGGGKWEVRVARVGLELFSLGPTWLAAFG